MKSKKSILYILGAGASAEALPLVNSYTDQNGVKHRSLIGELTLFSEVLKNKGGNESYFNLCQEVSNFLTPDTFARFLFLNDRSTDYNRFKILLSAYFFYREKFHEIGKPCADKRMLSFLTTICLEKNFFPENVKILTWNYDNQIAIACEKFSYDKVAAAYVKNFKAFPFKLDNTHDKNHTSLVYLNGIAGFAYNYQSRNIISKESTIDRPLQNIIKDTAGLDQDSKIIKLFSIFENPTENLLISFAWEKDSTDSSVAHFVSERLEYARGVARATDILVVIGYSFPFFNREIDNMIFKEMPGLQKIYFQDPNLDGIYLRSQFSLSKEVQIENITQVSHYFVPFEL